MDAYEMARAAGAFGVADELERLKVEYAAAIERGMLATAELQGQLAEAHGKLANANVGQLQLAKQLDDREAEVERLRGALDRLVRQYESEHDADAPFVRPEWLAAALPGEGEQLAKDPDLYVPIKRSTLGAALAELTRLREENSAFTQMMQRIAEDVLPDPVRYADLTPGIVRDGFIVAWIGLLEENERLKTETPRRWW